MGHKAHTPLFSILYLQALRVQIHHEKESILIMFIVHVACIKGLVTCPLPQGLTQEMMFKNKAACVEFVGTMAKGYGYAPQHFIIDCEPKK